MGGVADIQTSKPERVRLHITPFNADLLDRVVPPSLRSSASNISFHAVQTFPERGFGFVELPAMEAEKLKKKLNGMTLKGTKVRIEEAKPERRKRKAEVEEGESERKKAKKTKKEKRKREDGVLPGHELEEGRHVKRGWKEEGQDRKEAKKPKKQQSDGAAQVESLKGKKLQFKTSIPPNAAPIAKKSKDKTKDKKEKEKRGKKKVIVEEGKKSSKVPYVAGQSVQRRTPINYEDGKGWVDEDGTVIEAEPESRKRKRSQPSSAPASTEVTAEQDVPEMQQDSMAASADTMEATEDEESDSPESSDDVSSEEPSDVEMDDEAPTTPEAILQPADIAETNGVNGGDVDIDNPEHVPEVHPLEALFKRPAPKLDSASKPKPSPINTSFSFFNPEDAAEEDDDTVAGLPPQTPHTKQDMEWRSIRSAAPTPDTAAIGRKFSFPFAQAEDDEEDEDDADDGDEQAHAVAKGEDVVLGAAQPGAVEGEREESEYRKWFYDNRGDLNRGWKKRRREERKQKRQRANRRLGSRVV